MCVNLAVSRSEAETSFKIIIKIIQPATNNNCIQCDTTKVDLSDVAVFTRWWWWKYIFITSHNVYKDSLKWSSNFFSAKRENGKKSWKVIALSIMESFSLGIINMLKPIGWVCLWTKPHLIERYSVLTQLMVNNPAVLRKINPVFLHTLFFIHIPKDD